MVHVLGSSIIPTLQTQDVFLKSNNNVYRPYGMTIHDEVNRVGLPLSSTSLKSFPDRMKADTWTSPTNQDMFRSVGHIRRGFHRKGPGRCRDDLIVPPGNWIDVDDFMGMAYAWIPFLLKAKGSFGIAATQPTPSCINIYIYISIIHIRACHHNNMTRSTNIALRYSRLPAKTTQNRRKETGLLIR